MPRGPGPAATDKMTGGLKDEEVVGVLVAEVMLEGVPFNLMKVSCHSHQRTGFVVENEKNVDDDHDNY